MIKAYFFDWMGTLGDAEERTPVREMLTAEQHNSLLTNKFDKAQIPEEYRALIYAKLENAKHTLYPDSEEMISRLRSNYKLAIISNIYDLSAMKVRNLFPEFLGEFDFVTFSSEVKMRKPFSEIFFYTLNKLNEICRTNIVLQEVVMVGDKLNRDINPALDLGMQAKIIDRGKQTLEEAIK